MLLHFLLGVLIVVGIALTVIILFQRSEGGALGMGGGGGGGQFMSARGASNLLTRTTQVLAAIFFVLALTITILTGRSTGTAAAISDLNVEDLDTSTLNQPAQAPGSLLAPPPTVGGAPLDPTAPAPANPTAPFGAPPLSAPIPAAPAPAPATPAP